MKIKTMIISSVFFLHLAMFSSFAHAIAISHTSATIDLDWSSLDSQVVWSSSNFKFNGADAARDGVTDSNYQTEPGWGGDPNLTYTATITPGAVGTASTTATSAQAIANAWSDGISSINASASGTSHRGNTFSPIADGQITFNFAYSLDQIFDKDLPAEVYSGFSIAELILRFRSDEIGYDSAQLVNTETTDNGFLSFTADLLSANTYYLEGHVYSAATTHSPRQEIPTVPEPATLALFGIGLAGMGFARRKKKSA